MKKPLFVIGLHTIIMGIACGQTLDGLPPKMSDDLPEIDEMLNDAEFIQLYEQMSGHKLTRDTLFPSQAAMEFPNAPPMFVPPQNPSRLLIDIAVQQLVQLDGHKSVQLQNLHNAETCGYRAAKFASEDFDRQTDFESRRYVPSSSRYDWAIHGDGFFVLRKQREPSDADESTQPDESDMYYTRAGRFELTDDDKLCLKHDGETYLLQPEKEYLTFSDLFEPAWQLARFKHPERLWRIDGVLFRVEADGEMPVMVSSSEASGTTIHTQEYEASNVDFAETWQVYRALHKMQSAILESVAF